MAQRLTKASASYIRQSLYYERYIFFYLLAIPVFLLIGKIIVVSRHLTFPPLYEVRRDKQAAICLPYALAMHIPLPMRPSFMLDVRQPLEDALEGTVLAVCFCPALLVTGKRLTTRLLYPLSVLNGHRTNRTLSASISACYLPVAW